MIIFPAIDLYEGKAVRLFKGDYNQMTVYGEPTDIAADFLKNGATHIHIVDLEGAKNGDTPNFSTVLAIKKATGLFCEIGGGVRSLEVVKKYVGAGIDRVILGTAAVTDRAFLKEAVALFGDRIAVGADIKDGFIAVKGWTEKSTVTADDFFADMQELGVKTIICTDISKDGAMQGTNRELYRSLNKKYSVDITASGGVSSIEDVAALKEMGMYAAIIGKAYYTGAISVAEAIEVAK
ncbi:MAG: 1-(5-phosphoribosyl)-5-[(5-phosphoribosylamino)methylideneamino]imidazole-4-carboxamide isomerase [Clostridia bacterium]|nr:1-(5-phosphoribosyl)-5-[(5-phosphoribosylamino)methylideneamino]imidazole-4-carboxamide isomerase [Clostridia bacterium]